MPQDPASSARVVIRMPDGTRVPLEDLTAAGGAGAGGGLLQPPTAPEVEPPPQGIRGGPRQFAEDLKRAGIAALPFGAGLATSGLSAGTAIPLMMAAGAAQGFLEGDDETGMLTDSLVEGSIESVGRALAPIGSTLVRGGLRLASGTDEAAQFANRIGRGQLQPGRTLAESMIQARAPLSGPGQVMGIPTRGGMGRAGDQARAARRDLAAQTADAAPVRFGEEVRPSIEAAQDRFLGRSIRQTDDANALAAATQSLDFNLGQPGDEIPIQRVVEILLNPPAGGQGARGAVDDAVVSGLEQALQARTTGNPLRTIRESEALEQTLSRLLPSSSVVAGPGQMTTRATLAGMGATPALAAAGPPGFIPAAAGLFTALAPVNMSRAGIALDMLGKGTRVTPRIADVVRGVTAGVESGIPDVVAGLSGGADGPTPVPPPQALADPDAAPTLDDEDLQALLARILGGTP